MAHLLHSVFPTTHSLWRVNLFPVDSGSASVLGLENTSMGVFERWCLCLCAGSLAPPRQEISQFGHTHLAPQTHHFPKHLLDCKTGWLLVLLFSSDIQYCNKKIFIYSAQRKWVHPLWKVIRYIYGSKL